MEIDHFLLKVQGVLRNELLGNLSLLRKENEDDIQKVVKSLGKTLDCDEFNEKTKEKLYILLYLNTDTEAYNDLKKNRKIAHLVGFLPKLSKDLFTKIVINLKLHQYFYESVAYLPPGLTCQVLDMCLTVLSWIDLFEAVSFVENLLSSLFYQIVIIEDRDEHSDHLKDLFQSILLHYDAEKGGSIKRMTSWKSTKLKHYGGLVMASLLSLLENCTNMYCKKERNSSSSSPSLYDIQINALTKKFHSESGNKFISVHQCYEHVLARCHENLCNITIDLWLFWVEIDLDDVPDTENTLQRLVGEKAYTCRECLREAVESFGISSKEALDMISRLQNIALKPKDEDDEMSTMNLDGLLEKIQGTSMSTEKWIRYLLKTPEFAVDPKTLEVIKCNLTCLLTSDIKRLADHVFSFIKTSKNCSVQKSFVLEAVKLLDAESLMAISECFVKELGSSQVLKVEEFQTVFIETFNKVINEEQKELFSEFVWLALQNAKAVVGRAVAEGITSELRGNLMVDILGRLQPFCDIDQYSGSSLLVAALYELLTNLPEVPESQQRNYPAFVMKLVNSKLLKADRFLTDCVLVHLDNYLRTKNWIVLTASIQTISDLLDQGCVTPCLSTLAMLVVVLQSARWTPDTFCWEAVHVCELTQQLIRQFVQQWFDANLNDKALKNMVSLMQCHIKPIDRYHLHRLLQDEQMPANDPAMQLVYRIHYGVGKWSFSEMTQEERIKLVYSMCFVLPVLSPIEWMEMFCVVTYKPSEFAVLFNICVDSLLLCLDSAKLKNNPSVISCLSYACLQVAQAVNHELIKWTENDTESRVSTLSRLCQLLAHVPMPQQEDLGQRLLRLLTQLLPVCGRPLSSAFTNVVTEAIASLQAPNTKQSLARAFLQVMHSSPCS